MAMLKLFGRDRGQPYNIIFESTLKFISDEDSQQIKDSEEISSFEPVTNEYHNLNQQDYTTTNPETISVESPVETTSDIITSPQPVTVFESDTNAVRNLETDENISNSAEYDTKISESDNNNHPIVISIHKPNLTTKIENHETNGADVSNQINHIVTESNSSSDEPTSIELTTSSTENSNALALNLDRYKTGDGDDNPESSVQTLEPYSEIENDSEPSSLKITEQKSSTSKTSLIEIITPLTENSANFVTETENNEKEDIAEPYGQIIDHSAYIAHDNTRSDPITTESNGPISEINLFGLITPATKKEESSFDITTNSDARSPIVTEPNTLTTESPLQELIEQITENSTNLPSKIENSEINSVSQPSIIEMLESPPEITTDSKISETISSTTELYLTEGTTPTEDLVKLDMNIANNTNDSGPIVDELIPQSKIKSDNKPYYINLTYTKQDNSQTNIVNWFFLASQSVKIPTSESQKLIMGIMMTNNS